MDETRNKAEYIVASINEFARRHTLSNVQAYRYLKLFKGIDMLDKFYDIMHTLSFKDTTDDLTVFCHKNGGQLV